MNQQRSRRFRSSKEAEKLAATILARDGSLPDRDAFDSNCITPGTDFMLKLGLAMRKWVQYKQQTDPLWKNGCDVVVSGPDVPGEGEHKVSTGLLLCIVSMRLLRVWCSVAHFLTPVLRSTR
jgi:5'-3' exoribonuclease 1